jgi:N-acetylglucosamine-6-phosphate deacetylase
MSGTVFMNVTVVLPDRLVPDGMVTCSKGRITAVEKARRRAPEGAEIVDAKGGYLSPGFVDIHVHGGAGADFMDGTGEAVRTVCCAHAKHGTPSIFPTTTTGSIDQVMAMLQSCRVVQASGSSGAAIAGTHLYGPYFAEDKVGCHQNYQEQKLFIVPLKNSDVSLRAGTQMPVGLRCSVPCEPECDTYFA